MEISSFWSNSTMTFVKEKQTTTAHASKPRIHHVCHRLVINAEITYKHQLSIRHAGSSLISWKKCFRQNYLNQYFSNPHAIHLTAYSLLKVAIFLLLPKSHRITNSWGTLTLRNAPSVLHMNASVWCFHRYVGSVSSSSFNSEHSGRESFGFFYSSSVPFSSTFSWWWLI